MKPTLDTLLSVMQNILTVAVPRDDISNDSYKRLAGNCGETYWKIVTGLHWRVHLVK